MTARVESKYLALENMYTPLYSCYQVLCQCIKEVQDTHFHNTYACNQWMNLKTTLCVTLQERNDDSFDTNAILKIHG